MIFCKVSSTRHAADVLTGIMVIFAHTSCAVHYF